MGSTQSKIGRPAPDEADPPNGAASRRRLRLTPAWTGRDVSLEDFENADFQSGWRYELIDGRVEVFPTPNPPHAVVVEWVNDRLRAYRDIHPEVINYVTPGCRIFIPGRLEATCPNPDLAAFRDFPLRWPLPVRNWQDINPILAVEVISPRYANKDLVRNVTLYREAPSVREYWIFDPRDRAGRLSLRAYRKRGRAWQRPIDVSFGGTYTTPHLPGFTLIVDPNA